MLRRFVPVLCCLLAFGLAAPLLAARALWGDEAFSVWASKAPAVQLMLGLDAQPPLYHLMLKCARALWGESVFAVRFASLLCGVLCVPAIWRMTRRLGARAALIAALAAALSPLSAYYQQEARMYAPALLFCVLSMTVTIRSLVPAAPHSAGAFAFTQRRAWPGGFAGGPPRRDWLLYTLATLAALYTHFYTLPVLAVNSVALLFAAFKYRCGRFMALLSHAAVALLFGAWFFGLQWAVLTKPSGRRAAFPPPWYELTDNIVRGANGLLFGQRADAALAPLALLALGMLTFTGITLLWRRGCRVLAVMTGAWLALTALFVFATASRSGVVPDFNPRYVLFLLPALCVCAAACAWRPLTLRLVLAAALGAGAYGQIGLLDARWQKSRYFELIEALRTRAQPGDAALLLNSDQFPLLDYYGPVGMPVWIMSNALWDERQRDTLAREFESAVAGKQRAWLLKYGFASPLGAGGWVEQTLEQRAVRLTTIESGDAVLSLYDLGGAPADRPVIPIDALFGENIRLTGVRVHREVVTRGGGIGLDLRWEAVATPARDYTVMLHVRRADTGAQLRANDGQPSPPTGAWRAGQVISETRGVDTPADAAPGRYRLIVALYHGPNFERLPVRAKGLAAGADELVVGEVSLVE